MSKYQPADQERLLAVLTQLLAIPIPIVAPLVVWLVEGRRSPYASYWAKVTLFWQIFWLIGMLVSGLLMLAWIGVLTTPVLFGLNLVFCVLGAVKAYYNEPFAYWFVADVACKQEYALLYGAAPSEQAAEPPAAPQESAPPQSEGQSAQEPPNEGIREV